MTSYERFGQQPRGAHKTESGELCDSDAEVGRPRRDDGSLVSVLHETRLNQIMTSREDFIHGCVASHASLVAWLQGLGDVDVTQPSLLPNWTVGHVLTHIARNAEGCRNMLYGGSMYPGGLPQRNADIEAGAVRSFAEQVAHVQATASDFERTLFGLTDEQWAGEATAPFGAVTVESVPLRRWREVEVHRMDAGLGSTWQDIPSAWVAADLTVRRAAYGQPIPTDVSGLGDKAELAWLFSRPVGDTITPPPAWF
jgi:maleylpyruvate isomerase